MSEPYKIYVKETGLLLRYILAENSEIFNYFFEQQEVESSKELAESFISFLAPNPKLFQRVFHCLETDTVDWDSIFCPSNNHQFAYSLAFVEWILQDLNKYNMTEAREIRLFEEVKEKNKFYFDMSEYFAWTVGMPIDIFQEKKNQFILLFVLKGGLNFLYKVIFH